MNDETTNDAREEPTKPVVQATHVVKQWDAEDQRFFMNWMCGYNPDAVLQFELSRRQLTTASTERALGREPRAPKGGAR